MTTAEFIKTVGFHSLGGPESKEATYDIAMLALQRGIPGDFVECGVYAGASSALMARAIIDFEFGPEYHFTDRDHWAITEFKTRRVHLFDSFQGMPESQPIDAELHARGDVKGSASVSLPTVQANMQRWGIPPELLVYHPGWFEQTIRMVATAVHILDSRTDPPHPGRIAVLRLDADLYSSTQVIMKHLYPLVSPGGWIICDDYDLSGARLAVNEVVNPAPMYWRKR
jgi:predicted O-methyltransferase YrrM